MDIQARANVLCMELGKLDHEIRVREERRDEIRAELDVLDRLANEIRRAAVQRPWVATTRPLPDIHEEADHAPAVPAPIDAKPNGTSTDG